MLNRDPKVYSRRLTEAELKLVAEYGNLHGQLRTADKFNVSTATVRRALKLNGYATWPNGRPKDFTDDERQSWLKFKGSLAEAAGHFGVSESTIYRERHKQRA